MATILLENFKYGLDIRKSAVTSIAGSLRKLTNGHITRGGEIEKAKAMVATYTLPTGNTFGLTSLDNDLYTFGSSASPGTIPAGITYQLLQHPDGATAMSMVLDTDVYDSKLYVIAEFINGDIFHYYDGVLVSDWGAGTVRSDMMSNMGIASYLAGLINDQSDTVSASALGATITITANVVNLPFTITSSVTNGGAIDDQTATVTTPVAAGASAAQVSEVVIGGTFDVGDDFTITINDYPHGAETRPRGKANIAFPFQKKMYFGNGKELDFSAINQPTRIAADDGTNGDTGAGNIIMDKEAARFKDITGLGNYFNDLAIFSDKVIQIWNMDADPTKNAQSQVIQNTGTFAPKSIQGTATGDLRYLSRSGVRALTSHYLSNFASNSEIGAPIDEEVAAIIKALTDEQRALVTATTEPLDLRYMVAIDIYNYVFSFFAGSSVSAWSRYEYGIAITDFAPTDTALYARSGDVVYLYGGAGTTYVDENNPCVIITPFLDGGNPAAVKEFEGIDIALEGLWKVEIATDPNQPTEFELVGNFYQISYAQQRVPIQFNTTHIAVKFTSLDDKYGRISNLALHFDSHKAE